MVAEVVMGEEAMIEGSTECLLVVADIVAATEADQEAMRHTKCCPYGGLTCIGTATFLGS